MEAHFSVSTSILCYFHCIAFFLWFFSGGGFPGIYHPGRLFSQRHWTDDGSGVVMTTGWRSYQVTKKTFFTNVDTFNCFCSYVIIKVAANNHSFLIIFLPENYSNQLQRQVSKGAYYWWVEFIIILFVIIIAIIIVIVSGFARSP